MTRHTTLLHAGDILSISFMSVVEAYYMFI